MEEPDFSGIDPVHLDGARKRLAAIREYQAIDRPTRADSERIAASVGMSVGAFYTLNRAWTQHRNVNALAMPKRNKKARTPSISPRVKGVVEQVIADLTPFVKPKSIYDTVIERCLAEGLKVPSRGTVVSAIQDARAKNTGPVAGDAQIVIGRFWFRLPVHDDDGVVITTRTPCLLMAVALPERQILAHEISTDDSKPPSLEKLLMTLVAMQSDKAEIRSLHLHRHDKEIARSTLASNDSKISITISGVQADLNESFGGKLGDHSVMVAYGRIHPDSPGYEISRQEEPTTKQRAEGLIHKAVSENNASRHLAVPKFKLKA